MGWSLRQRVGPPGRNNGNPVVDPMLSSSPSTEDKLPLQDIVDAVAEVLLEDDAFSEELEVWCKDHCAIFAKCPKEDEHLLEFTEIHEQFCLLFERRIESFVEERGYSLSQFWQRLTKAIDDNALDSLESVSCFYLLKAATDYSTFATTMRAMTISNADTREEYSDNHK